MAMLSTSTHTIGWKRPGAFSVTLSMTFEMMVPFLKGFHLTLAKHNKGRTDDGWKLTNREWEAWLGHSVETGCRTEEEAAAACHLETEEG
jgi:hypothetical protein